MRIGNAAWAVGMDIGGTKVEGALVDEKGGIARTLRRRTPDNLGDALELIRMMVNEISTGVPIAGIGFSVPGSLDPDTGTLRNAPNSPALNGVPLARKLAERLPQPLFFENDANCLALSELHFGAARGCRHLVALILGTGVGAGVVADARLLKGSRGLAPEPGHMPLHVGGLLCGCGNLGCVEAYLSGPAILARYHRAGGSSSIQKTEDIFTRTDDPAAMAVLAETKWLFARFIAAMVSMYDPERFVLGGGLSLQPLFYSAESLISQFIFGTRTVPPIVAAQGGDASGKRGAAALVFEGIRNN